MIVINKNIHPKTPVKNPTTPGYTPPPTDETVDVKPPKPTNPTTPGHFPELNYRPNDHDGDGVPNWKDKDYEKTETQKKLEELYNQRKEQYGMVTDEETEREEPVVLDKGVNDVPLFKITDKNVSEFVQSICYVDEKRMYKPIKYRKRACGRIDTRRGGMGRSVNPSRPDDGNPNYNEVLLKKEGLDSYAHRADFNSKYSLRLGDSIFYIPPEYINVSESSDTIKEPSIRSTGTMKKKYGYSTTDISLRLMFNGEDQINGFEVDSPFNNPYYIDGLRPFLAQCKISPILAVENEFLNSVCGIHSIVINSVEIKTVPGFPTLLECNIMAMEFDSSIYTMIPCWEYSNLIEWDLYRYNYQRLMNDYVPDVINSFSDKTYRLKKIKDLYSDVFDIYIPNDFFLKSLDNEERKEVIFDMKKIKYNKYLSSKYNNFNVMQMGFGFENITITPKLSNSNRPTIQYMGSGDGVLSMNITTTSQETAELFKQLIENSQYIIKQLKDCSGIGFIKIDNEFLNLIGTNYLMIDSVSVQTVPDYPGLYSINMQASSHDVVSAKIEELKGMRPFWDNRKGEKKDCISQGIDGFLNKMNQDIYTEYKLNDIDLYPDLFLPTYTEIDYVIDKINTWRGSHKYHFSKIPFDKYPRKVSAETLYGKPYALTQRVDPDYYFMYPYLNFKDAKIKASVLLSGKEIAGEDEDKNDGFESRARTRTNNTEVDNGKDAESSLNSSQVDHVYKNVIRPTSDGASGSATGPNQDSINKNGTNPTSCADLSIKGARGVDTAFLDELLCKVGCGYVFGAIGQNCYAKDDPRWTAELEKQYWAHGGPVRDQWRNGNQVFDCSGFVGYGMYRLGYFSSPPRQHHTVFKTYCTEVPISSVQPGDFLTNGHHIAVAIGGGKTVEAMGKDYGVCIGNVGNRFSWAGRCKWNDEIIGKYSNYVSRKIGPNSNTTPGGSEMVPVDEGRSMNRSRRNPLTRTPPTNITPGGSEMVPDAENTAQDIVKLGTLGGNFDKYDDIIIAKSKKYGLNPNWVKALMRTESGMNPVAASNVAYGLMQLTDICCKHLGIPFNKKQLADPDHNTEYGTKYYAEMHSKYNHYVNAAGAYNVGPGAFDKYLAGNATIPLETINHMKRVQEFYDQLISSGGTDAGFTSGGTTTENQPDGVPIIQYVHKYHGHTIDSLDTKFGLPIIIESPINALVQTLTKEHADYASEYAASVFSKYSEIYKKQTALDEVNKIAKMLESQERAINEILRINIQEQEENDMEADEKSTMAYHLAVENSTDRKNKLSLAGSTIDASIYGSKGTMLRAFPTFAFVISSDKDTWFDGRKLWDNFYPYKSIASISITHDFEQPTGTAHITATNFSQNLSRISKIDYKTISDDEEYSWLNKMLYKNFGFILGTPKITDSMIDSHNDLAEEIKLQSGARIHIRMGYGSCFQNLPVVFNGTIAEISSGEYMEIIAQSDGAELINTTTSTKEDKTNGISKLNSEPSNIVTSLLIDRASWTHVIAPKNKWGEASEYHIEHFGVYMGHNNAILLNNRELEYDLCKNVYLGNYRQQGFCSQHTGDVFDGEEGVEFFLFNRTPWDAANICAQILPEFISYPVYHGFSTRLFYGLPYWMCKYRYDICMDETSGFKVKEFQKTMSQIYIIDANDIIDNKVKVSSKFLHTNAMSAYVLGNNAEKDIKTTATMFADTTIDWSKQKTKVIDTALQQNYIGPDGLYVWFGINEGVTNAEQIAITSLLDSFSKSYYDEIICLGNPSIKPYDEIFIDDKYGEMYGMARVNRVVHSLSPVTGFTTSITPGMLGYSKTEDSGSTNIHRNRMNLLDLSCSILSARKMAVDFAHQYKNIAGYISVDGDNTVGDYLTDSVYNVLSVTNPDKFISKLMSLADKIHIDSRKGYAKNIIEKSYKGVFSSDIYLRELTRYISRLPFISPVIGFFTYDNCIGLRPLLHKNKPFVSGIKGSKKLLDGFSEMPDYYLDE